MSIENTVRAEKNPESGDGKAEATGKLQAEAGNLLSAGARNTAQNDSTKVSIQGLPNDTGNGVLELASSDAVSSRLVRTTAHPGQKTVALTFDDGPNPKYTPQVLSILKEHNIKATFCLVGSQVKAHPELVREIVNDGHRLCDHTISHDEHLPKRSPDRIKSEILGDKELIQAAAPGVGVPYYRAPGGNFAGRVPSIAASYGMESLSWSVDTRDWQRPGVSKMLTTVDKQLRPGGVILMHDGGGERSQSIALLKTLIPKLEKQGYTFDFPA